MRRTPEQERQAAAKWRAEHPGYYRKYMKAWAAQNRAVMREHEAKWRAENREKKNAAERARYAANREKRAATIAKWKAANPEKVRAATARHFQTEKARQRRAAYLEAHRDQFSAQYHKRRAKKRGNPGAHTAADRRSVLASYHRLCVYCLGAAASIDHVDPVMRGGSNGVANLVPACRKCNTSKGDLPLLVWLTRRVPAPARAAR